MFDIGFWEMALIGVIALLVIGPERLPGLVRTVGLWVGRIRRYVAQVREDIEREVQAEELKQLLDKPKGLDDLYDVVEETKGAVSEAKKSFEAAGKSVQSTADEWAQSIESPSGAGETAPGSEEAAKTPPAAASGSATGTTQSSEAQATVGTGTTDDASDDERQSRES